MKNSNIINAFRRMYEALIPELHKALTEAIVESIHKVSGGKGTLDLQEFHMEDGYDDPATVLVEVNRNTGDQANETVDCIVVNNKSGFWIGTENGGIDSTYISTEEMLAIYDELSFIEDHIDNPECEFTVEDGKITLKD
jgi:hypothetical protein